MNPRKQRIEAVFEGLLPAAVKTGMLFSREIVRVAAEFFKPRESPPLIVDPVMVSTSGARLLESPAVEAVALHLLPLATLVTPNLDEAAVLVGRRIDSVEQGMPGWKLQLTGQTAASVLSAADGSFPD